LTMAMHYPVKLEPRVRKTNSEIGTHKNVRGKILSNLRVD